MNVFVHHLLISSVSVVVGFRIRSPWGVRPVQGEETWFCDTRFPSMGVRTREEGRSGVRRTWSRSLWRGGWTKVPDVSEEGVQTVKFLFGTEVYVRGSRFTVKFPPRKIPKSFVSNLCVRPTSVHTLSWEDSILSRPLLYRSTYTVSDSPFHSLRPRSLGPGSLIPGYHDIRLYLEDFHTLKIETWIEMDVSFHLIILYKIWKS